MSGRLKPVEGLDSRAFAGAVCSIHLMSILSCRVNDTKGLSTMYKRIGGQTVRPASPPSILGFASVVGNKEGAGPLKNTFDYISDDQYFGEKT